MKFRLQYSLLTLLLLTTVCAVVVVYVVVPWRHRLRQDEIWTRLSSKANLKIYQTPEGDSDLKTIEIFRDQAMVRFLIDNMEDCERIAAISLYGDTFSDEDLQQLARLKNLHRIDLHDCPLSQKRMQILSELPLTTLNLQQLTCQDFQRLVLPRTLKHLCLSSIYGWHHFPGRPTGEPWPRKFIIDNLPDLESLHLHFTGTSTQDTTIQLGDIPRLKNLFLMVDHPAPESRIGSLPSIEEIHISQRFWPQIRQHSLSQIKKLTLAGRVVPFELADFKKILALPNLEELQLSILLPSLEAENLVVPKLPNLRDLSLNPWSIEYDEQKFSAELLTKIVLQAPKLDSMFVSVDKIHDALLTAIATRPMIQELRIGSRQCQASLAVLSKCEKLQDLYLRFPLRNEHMLDLNQLQHLTELHLMDDENKALNLKLLKPRPNLKGRFNFQDLSDVFENSDDSSTGQELAN